jgi:hypothetical protein
MATKKPPTPDPNCEHCQGRGWARGANGWPVECRCLERDLPPGKPRKPVIRKVRGYYALSWVQLGLNDDA